MKLNLETVLFKNLKRGFVKRSCGGLTNYFGNIYHFSHTLKNIIKFYKAESFIGMCLLELYK